LVPTCEGTAYQSPTSLYQTPRQSSIDTGAQSQIVVSPFTKNSTSFLYYTVALLFRN